MGFHQLYPGAGRTLMISYVILILIVVVIGFYFVSLPQPYNRSETTITIEATSTMVVSTSISENTFLPSTSDYQPTYFAENVPMWEYSIHENYWIASPEDGEVYNSREILLNFSLDKESDVSYKDDNEDGESWRRICSDCWDYEKEKLFKEGENNLTFKAIGFSGNISYINRSFFVDSKKPKIKKTEPKSGFGEGNFYVEIQEANPNSLVLHYGDANPGMRTANVDLESCEDIKGNSEKKACNVFVPLIDYDGKEIEYWFNLTDIAGNYDESRHYELEVDTTFPVINSLDYTIDRLYVTFNINITEGNFDGVSYIDWSDTKPKWKTLCSRLKDDMCIRKKSFRKGLHNIDFQVTDKAGNAVGEHVEFEII